MMQTTDHLHPRHLRKRFPEWSQKSPKPLFAPIAPLKEGQSNARKKETYRGFKRNRDPKVHGALWLVNHGFYE